MHKLPVATDSRYVYMYCLTWVSATKSANHTCTRIVYFESGSFVHYTLHLQSYILLAYWHSRALTDPLPTYIAMRTQVLFLCKPAWPFFSAYLPCGLQLNSKRKGSHTHTHTHTHTRTSLCTCSSYTSRRDTCTHYNTINVLSPHKWISHIW